MEIKGSYDLIFRMWIELLNHGVKGIFIMFLAMHWWEKKNLNKRLIDLIEVLSKKRKGK